MKTMQLLSFEKLLIVFLLAPHQKWLFFLFLINGCKGFEDYDPEFFKPGMQTYFCPIPNQNSNTHLVSLRNIWCISGWMFNHFIWQHW